MADSSIKVNRIKEKVKNKNRFNFGDYVIIGL